MPYGSASVDTFNTSTGQVFSPASGSATMKNRIINGAMVVDQRNAGGSVSTSSGSVYSLDRWYCAASATSKYSAQQNVNSATTPAGFTNYLGITSAGAYSSGATDRLAVAQFIEGYNTFDLAWGTVNAKTVTLSFWVQSSLTGTFGGAISNYANTRSYPFSYTISSANTWTYITITIPGDTSGTWVGASNGGAIDVWFNLGCGTTYSGSAGSWASADYRNSTGSVAVTGTSGATWYITGVQLEQGSVASAFDYRHYGQELALCQRYYWKVTSNGSNITGFGSGQFTGSTNGNVIFSYPVTMRASPTMSYSGSFTVNGGASGLAVSAIGSTLCSPTYGRIDVTVSGATTGYGLAGWINTASTDYVQASAEL